MGKVFVDLKKQVDDSYEITIGSGFIADTLKGFSSGSDFFMIDDNVFNLYSDIMPTERVYRFRADEHNKTHESVVAVLGFLFRGECRRDGRLILIGGGITGDVGGFVAATYMRGISFIQIPTTLLSMVDSSVGGKTGINFRGAKNNVGVFAQPKHVYIDMDFLKTLTDEEYLNGVAEVIKYGMVYDSDFLEYLYENKDRILGRDTETLDYIVTRCCSFKASVVRADEKEHGERALLNFGHTFAHAIETDSDHMIKHGFAVATGMYLETDYAVKHKLADAKALEDIGRVLKAYGFDLTYDIHDKDVFFGAMTADKKADKKGLTLAIAPKTGTGKLVKNISIANVTEYFTGS
ncbi:MAG: 3-dehydroquinate synthase [Deferribacterales bacterium]